MKDLVVGLDLGGTKILSALVSPSGEILDRRVVETQAGDGRDAVLARIEDLLSSFMNGSSSTRIAAIGLCAPGPLDHRKGVILAPPNLPGWNDVSLTRIVRSRFGLPTTLDKDANAQALAEFRFGAARGRRDGVFVTASTGIGGALVVRGRLVRGTGLAGEVGHMVVAAGGPLCNCGGRGCLEALASGVAIAREAEALAARSPESLLGRRLAQGGRLSAQDVDAAHREGDQDATRILSEAGRYLGIGLASLVNLLSPEVIVVGGGLTSIGDVYLGPALAAVSDHSYVHRLRPASIEIGSFQDTAGVIGAAIAAYDAIRRRPRREPN